MIQVSDNFKKIMQSNIRPKCEPIIKLSGIDERGMEISKIWKSSNIKNLKYKRGIDPAGRSLPFMELTWTEIYTGALNSESIPIIYENMAKYMSVDLSFNQHLDFNSKSDNVETIKFPRLFLESRPKIEGSVITWTAKDALYFLNDPQIKAFRPNDPNTGLAEEDKTIPFINPLLYMLVNSRGSFKTKEGLFKAVHRTIINIEYNIQLSNYKLDKDIIIDGISKDNIRNYANIISYYWDYGESFGSALLKHFSFNNYRIVHHFKLDTMYGFPKITNGANVGGYSFKHYTTETDTTTYYERLPSSFTEIQGHKLYRWDYDKYGSTNWETNYVTGNVYDEINYALGWNNKKIRINPVNHNVYNNYIIDGEGSQGAFYIGEDFVEDNPINPYDKNSVYPKSRLDVLRKYFNSSHSVLEFETLPNLSIETGDIVTVDTNMTYYIDGQYEPTTLSKTGVVVETELNYNGALREKRIIHEVSTYD